MKSTSAGTRRHEVVALVVLGKGDHFANALLPAGQHDDPVETEGNTAVGRGPVLKGTEDVTEVLGLFLFIDPENGEQLGLQVAFVDPDTSRHRARGR